MTDLYYLDQIHPHMRVGDLAEEYYPNIRYDTALPQAWVDTMIEEYDWDPRGQVVFGYVKSRHPSLHIVCIPLPLTIEAADSLADVGWAEHPEWESIVVPKIKRGR